MTMQPDELKAIRKSLKMTQEAFGDAIGIARLTVGLMERGAAPITPRTEKMVNALLASGAVDRQIVDAATEEVIAILQCALNDPATNNQITFSREQVALMLGMLQGYSAASRN